MNSFPATLAWCVLQVTLLAAFVATWCLVLRRSGPATRSLAAFTGLALIVILTFASFAPWPRWSTASLEVFRRTGAESPKLLSPPLTASNAPSIDDGQTVVADTTAAAATEVQPHSPAALFWESVVAELQAPAPTVAESRWTWPTLLAAAILVGVAIGLVRLMAGLILVRSYRARCRSINDSKLLELRDVLQAELNCPQSIELLESNLLATAATIGWRKPLVLLPANWREWSDDERRAVLAHEIAHIQRQDFLTWVAAQGALVLHFYHPLVHWLCGRLRLEQELAADAAAARLAGGQQTYLATLAAMALRQADRPVAWPARTFLPTRGTFLRRIEMLRDTKLGSTTSSIGMRVGTVGVILAAGLAISGLRGGAGPMTSETVAADQKAEADSAPPDDQNAKRERRVQDVNALAADGFKNDTDVGLTYVPRDALMVARVRPGEFLKRPEFAAFVSALKEKEYMKPALGIGIDRVDEFTLIALPSTPAAGTPPELVSCIVKARQAEDIVALTKFHLPKVIEQEYTDRRYFKGQDRFDRCYLPIDERTVIFATENALRRMIVASATGGGSKAKWSAAWADVVTQPAVLLVNTERLRDMLVDDDRGPVPQGMVVSMVSNLSALWQKVELLTLALKVDSHLTVLGDLKSGSEDDARKVHEILSAVVRRAVNALSQARANAAQTPEKSGAALLIAADIADSALDGVKVETAERVVRFSTSIPEKEAALLISLLLPAVTNARATALQANAKNNLKRIGLALHNYHDSFKTFPSAVFYGPDGKAKHPHSWRVAILPFVDQAPLFNQYNFNEPWDSENNKKVLAKMPSVYRDPNDPADSTNSSYFALVDHPSFGRVVRAPGTATAFSSAKGTQMREIEDGTSNVLLVVEAKRDIPWTKPEDIPYAADKPLPKLGGHAPEGFFALFCDGHVDFISDKIDEKTLRLMITMDDGNPVKFEQFLIRDGRPVSRPGVVK